MNRDVHHAWDYHNATKHSYQSVRTSPHYLDWANMPSPFKVYPAIEPIPLPRELIKTGAPALAAIATHIDPASLVTPTFDQLAALLYYSAGVTKTKSYPGGQLFFRAAACAGALYPTETYVVCSALDDLPAGVYHFNPGDFSLRRLREGDYRAAVTHATGDETATSSAPLMLIYSAISWRSTWKYRDRAYRYHFWDNGMILANALAVSAAHRLPAKLVMGFTENEVNQLIGIDGKRELALSLLAVGHTGDTAPPLASKSVPSLNLDVIPLSHAQLDYGSIPEMHSASSFTDEREIAVWRQFAVNNDHSRPATGKVIALELPEPDRLPGVAVEEVIQLRASTRRFARKAIPFSDLSVILDRSTRGVPADFLAQGSQLNDLYLIINRVEGLEAGAYFYRRAERSLETLKVGDFSERATYLSLDQDLGGDAAATLFFMADLNPLLSRLGNRAYRAAQIEAGIIGGRAYLAGYALRRGATGLTFYDDEVTEFFSPHAAGKSCIFEVAIGVPGKRPLL
jgi:SagB-type dehydrogenase family enzyme